MTRRQLPLPRVERPRQRRFELGKRPRRLPAGGFLSNARDVGWRHHAAAVAEAGAHERRDSRYPFVGAAAAERRHHIGILLPVNRAGHSLQQHLDHQITMALQSRRTNKRRRHHRAWRRAVERLAHAIRAVTGEAHRAEDIVPLLQPFLFVGRDRAATAAAKTRRRRQQTLTDERHAPGFARRLRCLDEFGRVRQLEEIDRQHCLDDDILVGVFRERPIVVGK